MRLICIWIVRLKGMEMNVPQSVWERMKQSTFESFERIVDKAIQERVDFMC